jgi:hypothetical protein
MATCPLNERGKKCNIECAWWREDAGRCVIHFLYGTDIALIELNQTLKKLLEKLDEVKPEPKKKRGRPPGKKNTVSKKRGRPKRK